MTALEEGENGVHDGVLRLDGANSARRAVGERGDGPSRVLGESNIFVRKKLLDDWNADLGGFQGGLGLVVAELGKTPRRVHQHRSGVAFRFDARKEGLHYVLLENFVPRTRVDRSLGAEA